MYHDMKRRDVLRAGGVALVTVAAVGCDALSTNPSSKPGKGSAGKGGGSKPKEAPMLAAKVKDGTIPPLKKRMPKNPVVVKPLDQIGKYGGQWRFNTQASGYGTGAGQYQFCGYENLLRWDPEYKNVIGNVADSWEGSSDSKEYTFKLHPGILWSDGKPFTADDVVFACEDVLKNEELTPVPDSFFGRVSGQKIDDYTVKLVFTDPTGLLRIFLATRSGLTFTSNPAHYMKQFHKKYNPDVETLVKKAKLENWVALFQQMGGDYNFGTNPEKPSIYPWVLKENSKTQVLVERNPYYWKVDPEGSQLPYIDTMRWQVVSDDQASLLKVANGEVDYAGGDPVDKPVLAKSRDKGKYHFFDMIPAHSSDQVLMPNLAHKDPVMREINNNLDFRIGLSYAINRKELIDAVFQRQGEPWQMAPRKESRFYNEKLATQYLEYDLDKANEHLDKAYPKKNAAGIRLGPDGKPIDFQVDVRSDITPWVDTVELVVGYWKKVGVNAHLKNVSASLSVSRGEANAHDWAVWSGEGGLDAVLLVNPYNYLPTNPPYSFFGVPWCTWWRSHGEEGEAPPKEIQHQLKLYDQMRATSDQDEEDRLMKEILQICQEQFFVIGTEAPTTAYGVLSNRSHNFPKNNVVPTGTVWVYEDPAPSNIMQFYIED